MPTDDIEPWMIWGYYISPMMYGQNAIVMNEFLDKRWSKVRNQFSNCCFLLLTLYTCNIVGKVLSLNYVHELMPC